VPHKPINPDQWLTLFTDNTKNLAPQLLTDISKASALEIGEASPLA
jgi:hypothetical protein